MKLFNIITDLIAIAGIILYFVFLIEIIHIGKVEREKIQQRYQGFVELLEEAER